MHFDIKRIYNGKSEDQKRYYTVGSASIRNRYINHVFSSFDFYCISKDIVYLPYKIIPFDFSKFIRFIKSCDINQVMYFPKCSEEKAFANSLFQEN